MRAKVRPTRQERSWASSVMKHFEDLGYKARLYFRHAVADRFRVVRSIGYRRCVRPVIMPEGGHILLRAAEALASRHRPGDCREDEGHRQHRCFMGTRRVGLRDVSHGLPPARQGLQHHSATSRSPVPRRPSMISGSRRSSGFPRGALTWLVEPKPHIFGDNGLLKFTRDLLIMAVPFMVGALAAVAMGAPGAHLDRRPVGRNSTWRVNR